MVKTPFSPPVTRFFPMHYMAQSALPDWKVSTQLFNLKSHIFILLSKEQENAILLSVE